jgi:ABC-type lipoprotein release transport system permease subunit
VNALVMRLRAELRHRWRGWLGLVVMIGVFGGATIATVAGARRTDSAYPRFLAESNPYDQFLLGVSFDDEVDPVTPETLSAIPQVATVIRGQFFGTFDGLLLTGSADDRLYRTFNAVKIIEGKRPERADELGVPVAVAEKMGLRVGKSMTLDFGVNIETGKTLPLRMKVAAIVATAGEFPPESDLGPPPIHLTSAFVRENEGRLYNDRFLLVWLRRGTADLEGFREQLRIKFGGRPAIGYAQSALTKNVVRSFHLQATSLWLFAACLGFVGLLVLGQTLGRQALTEGIEYPALRALGLTRRDLTTLGFVRASLLALVGTAVAIPVAILLSPLAPRGLARAAEPHPGFAVDATALGLGALVAVAALMAFAAIPIVRAARLAARFGAPQESTERVSRGAIIASRAGASAPAVIGMRLALEPGRGRTAVPVRATIVGVALAVGAVVIALGFGASLNHLLATPRLYGVTWSALVRYQGDGDSPGSEPFKAAMARARQVPGVEIVGPASPGIPFFVDGVQADGMGLPAGDRTFEPPILSGRAPRTATEIVLGPKTLQLIGKKVGDRVAVGAVGVRPTAFTIVGKAVVPTVGHTANLGEGSLLTFEGLGAFDPDSGDLIRDIASGNTGTFFVRFRPGTAIEAGRARLKDAMKELSFEVEPPAQPADLLNFGRAQSLPFILSGMLGLLALATLAHVLFTSIARRRRDLAILKTLGFTRGETRRAVAWQSTTFIVVAAAIGLAFGILAARWLWTRYAEGLGILPAPRLPALIVLAIIPAGILIANALALLPGRSAARTRPALVLRAE